MATAVFHCNYLWPMSTDPKHLFLAKAVIPSLQEHNRYATVCREGGMELRKYA